MARVDLFRNFRLILRLLTALIVAPACLWGLYAALTSIRAHSAGLTTTRIAVIGDYGSAGPYELAVSNLVHSWNPDLVITTGDNNYPDGTAATIDTNIGQYYHDFIYPYVGGYGQGAPYNKFFPSLGNHDWHAVGAQPYLDYFQLPGNERYYTFTQGPVQLFAVDSDSSEPDGTTSTSAQATWLRGALAASSAPWKLVYFHHAPYSSATVHGSTTRLQWPYAQWGASAVLAGHDHDYERLSVSGFPYFVNGLGGNGIYNFGTPVPGSQVRYNGDYGAMLVEASDTAITFRFYSRANVLVDTYTMGVATPTPSATAAATATPSATATATPSATAAATATPSATAVPGPLLAGHVTWQGRPAQPNALQQLPITLTLKSGTLEYNYPVQTTDSSGFFTVSVAGVPTGTYGARAKGPKYLAAGGTVELSGAPVVGLDLGTCHAGDANSDNGIDLRDFLIMKTTFGKGDGDPGYDDRADFTGDRRVDTTDFVLLKSNFGTAGVPPLMPAGP